MDDEGLSRSSPWRGGPSAPGCARDTRSTLQPSRKKKSAMGGASINVIPLCGRIILRLFNYKVRMKRVCLHARPLGPTAWRALAAAPCRQDLRWNLPPGLLGPSGSRAPLLFCRAAAIPRPANFIFFWLLVVRRQSAWADWRHCQAARGKAPRSIKMQSWSPRG